MTLDLGGREIAAGLGDLERLLVDYPIANACLNATKILARKLIPLSRAVAVDRI
jgi:hypothetical protein